MNNNQKKNLLDKARFEESGFAPKPGDKAFQYAKVVNHCLGSVGKSVYDFCSESMPALTCGEDRFYSEDKAGAGPGPDAEDCPCILLVFMY